MEFKTINRDWVKNAAIIFLAVLLVLTFFSNTIMNRSLPEVATQMVSDGAITAKVRGTGTVAANGLHEVKATQTREIRAVMVKSGQEVVAGDVLFVLGAGDSAELEAAQDELRGLQTSYNSAAVGAPSFDVASYNVRLKDANKALKAAKEAELTAEAEYKAHPSTGLDEAKERLNAAMLVRDEYSKKYNEEIAAAKLMYNTPDIELTTTDSAGLVTVNVDAEALSTELLTKINTRNTAKDTLNNKKTAYDEVKARFDTGLASQTDLDAARSAVDVARAAYDEAVKAVKDQAFLDMSSVSSTELDAAQAEVEKREAEVTALSSGNIYAQNLEKATEKRIAAQAAVDTLKEEKAAADKSSAQVGITLSDLAAQINKQREKIKQLSGDSADQIVASVAGTIESVSCTSGDTKVKDDVLCTIEVPDMGYILSFSVTNDQAKRLRTGNTATVSNYYWGSQILATLTSIKTDPKSPQSNKLLTFDLTGDVTAGSELTLSVGEKSANYDIIVPNSAIRSDTNGSFVLKIVAKNSPLGNRYIAQRVAIETVANDDSNSAVTGDLSYGDYVITTSNAPIKTGDQVRMADT